MIQHRNGEARAGEARNREARPRLAPSGMAVGCGLPMVISFPGKSPGWATRATPADLLRLARHADRLGYRYLTVSDHPVVPRRAAEAMGRAWYAPLPTLAFIAAATERIGLCTHVLVAPYRHPLIVCRDVGTLDYLSGGRVILGVGTGHLRPEFRALGIDHASRGAATDAAIAVWKEVWSGKSPWIVEPAPIQQPWPRLWIGGNSQRALRRAIAVGDGWVPWQIDLVELRHLLDRHGRPGEVALPWTFDPLGVEGPKQSPDACLSDLARLRAAGVTAVTAGFPSRSLDELCAQLDAFAPVAAAAAVMG